MNNYFIKRLPKGQPLLFIFKTISQERGFMYDATHFLICSTVGRITKPTFAMYNLFSK